MAREEEGPDDFRLSIANRLEGVGPANEALSAFLERRGVDPDAAFSASLCLEEVVTNVIKYAHGDGREHEIAIEALLRPGELVLRVSDDGRPFDPLGAPPPDLDLPPEERPIGGVGIHLVRKLAKRCAYERTKGTNVLTLFFPLTPTV